MTALADFHAAVQAALAAERLGTPVFVRYQLHCPERGPAALQRLAQLAGVVRGWLNQPLARLYALGSIKSGQITLTLEGQGGGTALVSWANSPARGAGVDLILLGNQGALYHDAGTSILWEEPAAPLNVGADKKLLSLIERALQTSQPVVLKKGAAP